MPQTFHILSFIKHWSSKTQIIQTSHLTSDSIWYSSLYLRFKFFFQLTLILKSQRLHHTFSLNNTFHLFNAHPTPNFSFFTPFGLKNDYKNNVFLHTLRVRLILALTCVISTYWPFIHINYNILSLTSFVYYKMENRISTFYSFIDLSGSHSTCSGSPISTTHIFIHLEDGN